MSQILKDFVNYVKDNDFDENLVNEFYNLIDIFDGKCIALKYDNNNSGNGKSYLKRCNNVCKNGLFCDYHNKPSKKECVICKKPGRFIDIVHQHKYECYGTIIHPNLEGLINHEYFQRPINNKDFSNEQNNHCCGKIKKIDCLPSKKQIVPRKIKLKKNMNEYDKFSLSDPDGACSYIVYCKLSEFSNSNKIKIININGNVLGNVTYWTNKNVPEKYIRNNIIYDDNNEPIYKFKMINEIYRKSDKIEFINYIYNNRLIKTYDVELIKNHTPN